MSTVPQYKDSLYLEYFKNGKFGVSFDNGKSVWDSEKLKKLTLKSFSDGFIRPLTEEQVTKTVQFQDSLTEYLATLPSNGAAVLRMEPVGVSKRVSVSHSGIIKGRITATHFHIKTDDITFIPNHLYVFSLDHSVQVLTRDKVSRAVKTAAGFSLVPDQTPSIQIPFVYFMDNYPLGKDETRQYVIVPTPSDADDSGMLHVAVIPLVPKIKVLRMILRGFKTGKIDDKLSRKVASKNAIVKTKDSDKRIYNLSSVYSDDCQIVDGVMSCRILSEKVTQKEMTDLLIKPGVIGTPRRRVLIGSNYATGLISNGDKSVLPKYWVDSSKHFKNLLTVWNPISKIIVTIKPVIDSSSSNSKRINGWAGNLPNYDTLPKKLTKINSWITALNGAKIQSADILAKNPGLELDYLMQIIDYNNGFNIERINASLANPNISVRKDLEKTITIKIRNGLAEILEGFPDALTPETKSVVNDIVGKLKLLKDEEAKKATLEAAENAANNVVEN